jgi:hypothetical protein
MLHWHPNQVVIITPRGIVIVAQRLYECLEGRLPPDDLGLLRDYEWWLHLSELVNGIQIVSSMKGRTAS